MVLKMWLRISILAAFLLAGCVQPTPTPPPTATPGVSGAYPGLAATPTPQGGGAYPGVPPTATPFPAGYPSDGTAPAAQSTQPGSPYPAPTTGAAARLSPL